jgi:hypothetical protein
MWLFRGSNPGQPRGSSVAYHWCIDPMLVWKLFGYLLRAKQKRHKHYDILRVLLLVFRSILRILRIGAVLYSKNCNFFVDTSYTDSTGSDQILLSFKVFWLELHWNFVPHFFFCVQITSITNSCYAFFCFDSFYFIFQLFSRNFW